MGYPWQWMLSGHTHGRQVATSALGRRFYPHRYRHYTHGYYAVERAASLRQSRVVLRAASAGMVPAGGYGV